MIRTHRGQAAFEYIMIFGLAMLIILIAALATYQYIEDYRGATTLAQLETLAYSITNNAEAIYFFGAPSQLILDIQMPPRVESMMVKTNPRTSGCKKCTELLFNTTDGKTIHVGTEVPIRIYRDDTREFEQGVVRWSDGREDGSCGFDGRGGAEGCLFITPGLKRWRLLASGPSRGDTDYHVALRMVTG